MTERQAWLLLAGELAAVAAIWLAGRHARRRFKERSLNPH